MLVCNRMSTINKFNRVVLHNIHTQTLSLYLSHSLSLPLSLILLCSTFKPNSCVIDRLFGYDDAWWFQVLYSENFFLNCSLSLCTVFAGIMCGLVERMMITTTSPPLLLQLAWTMIDEFLNSVKEKLGEITTSVDAKVREAKDANEREVDKSMVWGSILEFVEDANTTLVKILQEGDAALPAPGDDQQGASGSQASVAGSSKTSEVSAGGADDMYGYDLSSDEDESEEEVTPITHTYTSKKLKAQARLTDIVENPYKDVDLSDLGGKPMPRYGMPDVYLNAREVCKRRVTTTKRITDADLDKNHPLYKHRVEAQKKVSTESTDGLPDGGRIAPTATASGFRATAKSKMNSPKSSKPPTLVLPYRDHFNMRPKGPNATAYEECRITNSCLIGVPEHPSYQICRELLKSPKPARKKKSAMISWVQFQLQKNMNCVVEEPTESGNTGP
eukprot:sb/3464700/